MIAGITRSGSAAANGIAPSVMKEAPRAQPALPFSCSATVKSPGRRTVASASAIGGTMPAIMTAAMIFSSGASSAEARRPEPGDGEAVGDLVERAAHVEGHHQAEDDAEQDGGAAAHVVQALVELFHQPADRLAEDDDHHQAADDAGEERDHQHRHQAAGPGGHRPRGDPVGEQAGEDAADDGAEEAGHRDGDAVGVGRRRTGWRPGHPSRSPGRCRAGRRSRRRCSRPAPG